MKRLFVATMLALGALAIAASPVYAQMAGALGKPLPSPDLATGEVSVRVVAGSPQKPVTGTDVTLLVNGEPRVARTDAAGRAFFKDLPAGATVQAKVQDDDKSETVSDSFALPAEGGVRLLLSTLPWSEGAGAGPPMAGAAASGAMPNPRQMSGEPRPDQNEPAGAFRVRLTYDDFNDVPVDAPVTLVGYAADGKVTTQVLTTDKEGRVQFTGLDRTGATSYFAMALLPRNNATDRLTAQPAVLDSRVGVRLILSSEKRSSTAPPIDDMSRFEQQDGAPGPGKIRVTLEGGPDTNATVNLVDAEQQLVVARGKPQLAPPDPADGHAQGRATGKSEVVFDFVPRPGQVVYAETSMHGQQYRSLPFQPVADRGTRVTLYIFPRVMFKFSLTSGVDDEYFGVNGRFEISNNSWAPYVDGPDGLLVPLPKGFIGGVVAEKDQGDVAVAPTEGFRISRPIAPGTRAFHAGFSLRVKNGEVTWKMDLPFGTFGSGMQILEAPGMKVDLPANVQGQRMTVPQGTFLVLPQISILPKQSMVMTLTGLPEQPGWKKWLPRVVGAVVVLMMLGGLGYALGRKSEDAATLAARSDRRQKLLDELVELEKTGKNEKRREQIVAELEQLWDEPAA